MGGILTPAITEFYLCDPSGIRLECLDYVTDYEYANIVNTPGPFRLRLPSKLDRSKVKLDGIIEIWRGFGPGSLKLDYVGFIRDWTFGDEYGLDYIELYGYSSMELLTRRIVFQSAGSAFSKKTGLMDDMMKEVVDEQMGASASAARSYTSIGGGFTVQADFGDGASLSKAFAYQEVLNVCQEISDASAQNGTNIYFDVVPIISSSPNGTIAFQFQTFTGQRGNDRTWDSSRPTFVGKEWGNMQNANYSEYHSWEKNYVKALGQGEGADRDYTLRDDQTAMDQSIWNTREGARDARQIDYGDTAALAAEAYQYLRENRPDI